MHTYHAYLYRHSKNQLFEYATLTIEEDYIYGIKYLKETYGAEISDVDSILKML